MKGSLIAPAAPEVNTPRVAVILPIRNEEESIAQCLQSIIDQNYPHELMEVLVIDGMSTDRTRQIVAEYQAMHPFIKLLENPKRIIPAAMNIGIRQAHAADVIVRVDGHTFLESAYIQECVRCLQQTRVGSAGGLQRAKGIGYVGQAIALTVSSPLAAGDALYRHTAQEAYVDTVYLGAFSRPVFDRIGLYNEELLRNEDYELNYRLRQAGFHIFLSPSIRSWYLCRSSLRALWSQYFQNGYWKAQMLRRYPQSVRLRQLVAPGFVLSLMVSGVFGLIVRPFWGLFALIAGCYTALLVAFAALTARHHGWHYLPILPLTLTTIHFGWGLGFLWGLIRLPGPRPPAR